MKYRRYLIANSDHPETKAIGEAFGSSRTLSVPTSVGAVKSYIGHWQGAVGLAGLMKTILILEHSEIVPNL